MTWCCAAESRINLRAIASLILIGRVSHLQSQHSLLSSLNTPHICNNATIHRPSKGAKRCRSIIVASIRYSSRTPPLQRHSNPNPHHPSRRPPTRNSTTHRLPRPHEEIRPHYNRHRPQKTRRLHRQKLRFQMARGSRRRSVGICGAEV